MSRLRAIILLLSMLGLLNSACSHSHQTPIPPPLAAADRAEIKRIVHEQPDFAADEICTSVERAGQGFSLTFRVAKSGDWYRSASDITAAFSSHDEPELLYFLKARMVASLPRLKEGRSWYDHAEFPGSSVLRAYVLKGRLPFLEVAL